MTIETNLSQEEVDEHLSEKIRNEKRRINILRSDLIKLIQNEVYNEDCLNSLFILANKEAEKRREKQKKQKEDFHKNIYPKQNLENVLRAYPDHYEKYKQIANDFINENKYFCIYKVGEIFSKQNTEEIPARYFLTGESAPKFYMAFIYEANLERIELTHGQRAWLGIDLYKIAGKKIVWIGIGKLENYSEEEANKILQKEIEKEIEKAKIYKKKCFQEYNEHLEEFGYLWPTKVESPKHIDAFIKDENLREPTPDERMKLYGSKSRRKVYIR